MNTQNIQNGLTTAKGGVVSLLKFIINNIAVPIIAVFLVGLIVFFITGAVAAHRQGEDYHRKIYMIVGIVIVLALVVSFPIWGWQLIGG